MHKTLTLLSFVLTFTGAAVAQQIGPTAQGAQGQKTAGTGSRLKSSVSYVGEPFGAGFYMLKDSASYAYAYATSDKPSEVTTFDWFNTAYLLGTKTSITYNTAGAISGSVTQAWIGTGWANRNRYTYTYDAAGNQTAYLTEVWEASTNSWQNFSRDTWSFSTSNERTGMVRQSWDRAKTIWYDVTRETYLYDAPGNQLGTVVESWDSTAKSWSTMSQHLNYFDVNNQLSSYTNKQGDASGTGWINVDSTYLLSVNTSGKPFVSIAYNWNGSKWVLSGRNSYTYFNDMYQTSSLTELWTGSNYANSKHTFTQYNSFNQVTSDSTETFAGGVWRDNPSDYYNRYSYESFTTVGVKTIASNQLQLYPNPARDVLVINFGKAQTNATIANIYTLTGQLAAQQMLPAASTALLSIRNLPAGQYLLELRTGTEISHQRFVKSE